MNLIHDHSVANRTSSIKGVRTTGWPRRGKRKGIPIYLTLYHHNFQRDQEKIHVGDS